ncbi:MAG TPA: UvrD-helicase domain-containing protein [Gammaproteobacteria bacterium]
MTDFMPSDQAARHAALDPLRSFIVQAPAGSGKTGLLTQRFLRLLACVEQPEEIVAITFTRKAAAEMRERILNAMRDARRNETVPGSANEKRTRELALTALVHDKKHGWGLLENPARLRVTTIDAFNAMLTRQLPIRSGLGQPPSIAEQASELYRAAALRLLAGLDRKDDVGEAMRALLAHLDNRLDELTDLLAAMLARRDLWLRHLEIGGLDRDALESALAREVENVLQVLDVEFPLHVRAEIPVIAERCAVHLAVADRDAVDNDWLRDLAQLETSPGSRARDLSAWQLFAKFLLTTSNELRKPRGLNAKTGFPSASDRGIGVDEKAARDQHKVAMSEVLAALADRPVVIELLQRVAQLPTVRYTDAQWKLLDSLNHLLPYAVLALQEIFRDRGEVDFPELAIRAREALGDAEAPTDLALRLDHQIRHLLVDEFQDTSHSQIDLLLRLTREWQPGDGRRLFLVGDPMQSIYQFREAEVGHFLAVRDAGLGELDLHSLRLTANFRSQENIVAWVNNAFAEIFPERDDIAMGAISFEPSEAVKPALDGAAIHVHAFAQHAKDEEAGCVVEQIRTALADADNATTAVLVRGRAHLARILPLLRENAVPFRAVELDSLESAPVVQDLLALTRALVNPVDTTALLAVLRAPWCGLDLHELAALARGGDNLCRDVLDSQHLKPLSPATRERLSRTLRVLDDAMDARGRMPLRERVETAWYALAAPAVLREHEDFENARLYFELLQQLEDAGDLDDVNVFDERLKKLFTVPDPDADEAVQVMTLHKAKGLQFDTVIIPALDQVTGRKDKLLFHWMERPQADGDAHVLLGPVKSREDAEGGAIYRFIERLKEEKESLERARLLYVGITRAVRHVHLLGKARYATNRGGLSLAPPVAGSLLELLWPLPHVRAAFEALPLPVEKPVHGIPVAGDNVLHRLPSGWLPPAPEPGPAVNVKRRGTGSESGQIIYEWAGDRVRHVGTLVHRVLERMARDGLENWNAENLQALPVEAQLAALGLPDADCAPAAVEVRDILSRVLESKHATWILAPHGGAMTEWALGGIDRDERVSVSIDRSFVDADGTRWIIDYKTSTHEGGNIEGFLNEQQRRYRGQLERYARLVHALEGKPVKVALYFPLQDAFCAWTPDLD